MQAYFDQIERVSYQGPDSSNPLAFRHYNPDEMVLGKRMEDHLRFAACYWHTFCWTGVDMFGVGAFDRPGKRRATRWRWRSARRTSPLSFSTS